MEQLCRCYDVIKKREWDKIVLLTGTYFQPPSRGLIALKACLPYSRGSTVLAIFQIVHAQQLNQYLLCLDHNCCFNRPISYLSNLNFILLNSSIFNKYNKSFYPSDTISFFAYFSIVYLVSPTCLNGFWGERASVETLACIPAITPTSSLIICATFTANLVNACRLLS